MTSVLSQVIDGPLPGRTGKAMSLGRDAAGKTGTVNDSAAVWFVGFTPDLAAAVATYDPRGGYGHPMQNITIGGHYFSQVFGSSLPGPIWTPGDACARWQRTPKTPFDLQTLDGLGTYVPPPPTPTPAPSRVRLPGSPGAPPRAPGAPAPRPRRARRVDADTQAEAEQDPAPKPSELRRRAGAPRRLGAQRRPHRGGDPTAVGPTRDARREHLHDRAHRARGESAPVSATAAATSVAQLVVGRAARAGSPRGRRARRARASASSGRFASS